MLLYAFVIFNSFIFKCVYVEFVVLYLYVLDLFLVVLILQLIASAVLICKSLWIKASAK